MRAMKTLLHLTSLTTLTASLVLAATPTAQQPCYAEFDGNVFQDKVSMGGPNFTNCFKTKAPTALIVFAVEVFTGEATGTSTVGLWSHDATKDEPKAELDRGNFAMSRTNSWQGANLSQPVILAKDEVFWVSWIPVNGCQASVENTGKQLPGIQVYKWSPTNSAPWNGPYQDHQWKFRLWCQPLGTPGITVIGSSCTDGHNNAGRYEATVIPAIGTAFRTDGLGLPPSQPSLVIFGLQKNFVSFDLSVAGAPGCFLHSDIVAQVGLMTTAGTPAKSDGTLTLPLPIPNDTTLRGAYVRSQLVVADPASRRNLGAVFSNGLGITIQ
jgi:hypothetical protein